MDAEDRIREMYRANSVGPIEDVEAQLSPDCVMYDTNVPPVRSGRAIAEAVVQIREQWGGAEWTIGSLVSTGNHVAVEWKMTGIQSGSPITLHGSDHYWVDDLCKISEIHQYWVFNRKSASSGLLGYDAHAGDLDVEGCQGEA